MPHLFVDNLTVIDCSVLDPKRGLIGASWIVDIELFGELDQQSMVFDFGHVKKRIKTLIDDTVDHKLVLPMQYPGLELNQQNDITTLMFTDQQGQLLQHQSPVDAICQVPCEQINLDSITQYLHELILDALPDNVKDLQLNLHQEDDYAFYYCYSHGLKKHDGNCQRIAHGHKSRIQIWENGKRSRTWEQRWSELWEDIYIGSQEDLTNDENGRMKFAYTGEQGNFMLELDASRVYLIDSDSTVECIAEHICGVIKQAHPDSTIRVKAFEGVKKGAIAEL